MATELNVSGESAPARPVISIRNLSFAFNGEANRALRNISLDIFPGEFVVIAGPSGCGKSTLSMAMAGHIPHVVEGRAWGGVFLDGTDTRQLDLSDMAAKVSLCQQDPEGQFCTLTVDDEVSFGPENLALPAEEVVRRRDASLAAVDCLHLKGREILQLSGGEQQRVAIASMLAMEPEVLILDEPTSSLGPDAALEVWSAIEKLRSASAMTIVVIEHKLNCLLALADRLIIMNGGEVVLDGPPEQIHAQYQLMLQPRPPAPVPWQPRRMPEAGGRETIHVRDLYFSYGEKQILRGISLRAEAGEFIGIVGSNGSGKTTFLSCLTGLNRSSSGEVEVEGIDVTRAKVSTIARKAGFVFQSPNHQLFESTVVAEVAFACKNFGIDGEAAARRLMEEYGITRYFQCHPLKLSHGEKRRLNLCSVLPHDPAILLLDEPFIGQDAANTARIIEDLLRLKRAGKTVVMVSHDMDTVFDYCDRVVLFDEGRILVDEAPAQAIEAIRALGKRAFLPGERRA
jgi:energy-coupling factor transport system ATP-binding protein